MTIQSKTGMPVLAQEGLEVLDRRCVLMGLLAALTTPTALLAAGAGSLPQTPTESLLALLRDMDDNQLASFRVVGQALIDRQLVPFEPDAIRSELDQLLHEEMISHAGDCAGPGACIGEFVSIDGWMMSRSEALACALACTG